MRILGSLTVAAALLLSGSAHAAGKYGTAGCGLGSLLFAEQKGGVQLLAATTNATGIQTFAISTGTSNCSPTGLASGTKNFVDANREALAKDAARGEGEAIGAIAVINQCKDVRGVGAALQRSFGQIFPSEKATNEEVTDAILKTLASDPSLGCGKS